MPVCASIEKQDTNRQKQQDKQEVTEKLHIVPGNSRAKIPFFVKFLLIAGNIYSLPAYLYPTKYVSQHILLLQLADETVTSQYNMLNLGIFPLKLYFYIDQLTGQAIYSLNYSDMNITERVTNIIVKPKEEWISIEKETTSTSELLTGYLLILALIPALGNLIGYWLVGYPQIYGGYAGGSFGFGLRQAIIAYVSPVISAYVAAYIINMLAGSFNSEQDFRKAMQLVVYSLTPSLIAGVFMIIPQLSILAGLAGLYGLYVLYVGMKPMMKTPDEKVTGYFVVSLLVIIVASILISFLLTSIFIGQRMFY